MVRYSDPDPAPESSGAAVKARSNITEIYMEV